MKTETRVCAILEEDSQDMYEMSHEEFIQKAEDNGLVWSLFDFQCQFNCEGSLPKHYEEFWERGQSYYYIRFIETTIPDPNDYEKVADWILSSSDSRDEIIWLLKNVNGEKGFKETYSDILNEDLITSDDTIEFQSPSDLVEYLRSKGDEEFNKASDDYILQEAHEEGVYVVKDGNFIICDCGDGNGVSKEHCDCEEK